MKFAGIILVFAVFSITMIRAQEIKRQEIDLDDFIQELFQQQDADVNYEDMYESLLQLYTNPLDLNKANRDELNSLFILSQLQINHFLEYRKNNGDLLSIYELQSIPDFDLITIQKLLPFVQVVTPTFLKETKNSWGKIGKANNTYFISRYSRTLETKKGYQNKSYQGSANEYYTRFRSSQSKDYSFGFTLEKDAGEKITWSPATKRYVADFISYHAAIFNKGKLKALNLGDFQLQFGQGLLLASGFNIGKGAETINTVKRNNLGIRSYTSVLEGNFFRGAAATYSLGRIDVTGFYSNRNVDGTVQSDSTSDYFSTVNISGLHRTANEIANKDQINEQVFGGNASSLLFNKNLHLGITAVNTLYSIPIQKKDYLYNKFEFSGTNNSAGSLDYSYVFRNFNFFGEAGLSANGGTGMVSGLVSSLSSKAELSMVYRNYSRDFHSLYGHSFGENSKTINEKGIYWGIKIRPFRNWSFNAYYDYFSFPWLKYRVDAPSQGNEYLIRANYNPSKNILFYGQVRAQSKEIDQSPNESNMNYLAEATKINYMLNMNYKASDLISICSRVQWSSYHQSLKSTYGYFLMQDISLDWRRFSLSTRFAIFDTDDYDTRQYSYEKDVLYSFSLPALYGKGVRTYLLMQFKLSKNIDCWIKYSRTRYRNQNTISSGSEEINGDHKSDIKVQVRYLLK